MTFYTVELLYAVEAFYAVEEVRCSPSNSSPRATATDRYCAPGPRPGHIPFTPAAKKILELTLREAAALHDSYIGVEHIALALTTIKQGLVPQILSEAGTPTAALRTSILDRYRRAS